MPSSIVMSDGKNFLVDVEPEAAIRALVDNEFVAFTDGAGRKIGMNSAHVVRVTHSDKVKHESASF